MKQTKKCMAIIDIVIIIITAIMILSNAKVSSIITSIKEGLRLGGGENLSFNLITSPDEIRAKAGDTVTFDLSVADISVGEEGLNSIVGELNYNEALFENMEVQGIKNANQQYSGLADWEVELNKVKTSPLYGKFCIYTMREGITENQKIVKMTLKLKSDLKPQTTEIKFTNIESSDGNY